MAIRVYYQKIMRRNVVYQSMFDDWYCYQYCYCCCWSTCCDWDQICRMCPLSLLSILQWGDIYCNKYYHSTMLYTIASNEAVVIHYFISYLVERPSFQDQGVASKNLPSRIAKWQLISHKIEWNWESLRHYISRESVDRICQNDPK